MSSSTIGKNSVTMNVNGFGKNTECQKSLKVYCALKFKNSLDSVIKWSSNKVNALSRVPPFLSLAKKGILTNSFFSIKSCAHTIRTKQKPK